MNGLIHLKQSLKGLLKKLLLLCLILFLFEVLFSLLASSAQIKAEMLKDMKDVPPVVQKIMGEGFMEAVLKYGLITFGFIHPFLYLIFILFIFAAFWQVLTSEITSGTIGFTLSRPISRKRLFINAAILTYSGLAVLALVSYLSTTVGIVLFQDSNLSLAPFISLAWNLYLLMIFIAGYIALFASFTESAKSLFTYASLLLFLFYILDLAAALWSPLKLLSPINPFSYYDPMKLLIGARLSLSQSVMIAAISTIMFAVSTWIFTRRDLPSG